MKNNYPLVSIIMPVYNTGKLLEHTIDSVIAQSYSNWELLLVDDGSTDHICDEICDQFASFDKRIKTFHKQNGGICSARNYGLERAHGDFIAFCDHDDEYNEFLIEKALSSLLENNSDLTKFCYDTIYDNGLLEKKTICRKNEIYDNKSWPFLHLINTNVFGTIWSCLYRRQIIMDNAVRFDETIKHGGEDFNFNLHLLPFVHRINIIPDYLYRHYIRGPLSTSTKIYDDTLNIYIEEISQINDLIVKFNFKKHSLKKKEYNKAFAFRMLEYISYAIKLKKKRDDIIAELRGLGSKYKEEYLYGSNLDLEIKLRLLIILWKHHLFYLIYYLFFINNKLNHLRSKKY
jgi:glycosyltransferase involved in cell wall biosynthesis